MSKVFSFNAKKFLAFSFFLILFVATEFLLIRLVFSSTEKQDSTQNPSPETSKYNEYPTVIIDAGHGGEDGGTIGINGAFEKDINLDIALKLEEMLRSAGVKTRLTRETDTLLYDRNSNYQGHKKSQDMAARLSIAEGYEDAIFVSIHMNSFSQSKYKGLQVYYSENSPLSSNLAQTVQSHVATTLQPTNTRKIKPSENNIYLLDKIKHPAILIECGFLSNAEECELLSDKQYQNKLCIVLYSAIIDYFDNYVEN